MPIPLIAGLASLALNAGPSLIRGLASLVGGSETADDISAQAHLAGYPEHQSGERHQSHHVSANQLRRRHSAGKEFASQYAQSGNAPQLQQRRQGKTEQQQQADEHYISNCLHLYCHSIFSKSLHDFSLAMAYILSFHFSLAKRKRDMSGHTPLSFL